MINSMLAHILGILFLSSTNLRMKQRKAFICEIKLFACLFKKEFKSWINTI